MPVETKQHKNRKLRVAEIRQNLLNMDQKILEHRQATIDNREYKGMDRHFRDLLLAYAKGRKRMNASGSISRISADQSMFAKKPKSSGMKLSKKEKNLKVAQNESFDEDA
mmetsp:Transcript_10112/g.11522  ORF Transcript_10112/g.11522 Transcript_10112/m.11522 type:complete len:110 (-) Transcript_10112:21-350(-)